MIAEKYCGNIFVESSNRNLLTKISEPLIRAGYKVKETDCAKHNAKCNGELPDLVIYDFTGLDENFLAKRTASLPDIPVSSLIILPNEVVAAQIRQDGKDNYLSSSFDPLALVGKVARTIEQNRSKSEIARNQTRFNNLFQSGMMGIILWDKGGRIIDANDSFLKIVGYSRQDLFLGKINWIELTPESYRQRDEKALRELETTGICHSYEKVYIHKNGKNVPVLLGGAFIKGELETGFSYVLDISERKTVENRLLEEQVFNYKTINSLPGIFYIKDDSGNLLRWNETFEKATGYLPEELSTMHALDFFAPADWKLIEETIRNVFIVGEAAVEAELLSKDGSKTFYFFTGKQVKLQASLCLVGMGIDTSERKQMERDLQESTKRLENKRQQLQALNARLQNIREEERTNIAREVHDSLGQALTAIKLDVSWINKKIIGTQSETLNQHLAERIGLLYSLIDESVVMVQDISAKLRPGLLDSVGLAAAIEWEVQKFEQRTEIACFCDLSDEKINLIPEKTTAVFRIFQELMTNVLRHAQATRIWVTLAKDHKNIMLTVRDNGRGISEKQAYDSNSLGLLGIRERAHLWKGSVKVNGEHRKGTEVIIQIPITQITEIETKNIL